MHIDEMSYFQTLDLEKALGAIERHRQAIISELNDVCGMLQDAGWYSHLDDLTTRLEGMDDVLELIWSELQQQQEALEEADSGAVLALTACS